MKQQNTTMKKIGDTRFFITPFPAFTAARISGELSNVLAPMLGSLSPLMTGGSGSENFMDSQIETMLPAFSSALGQLSGDKFEALMKQLLVENKNVAYENEDGDTQRLTYDDANEIFCGELQDMLILCLEVIKVNFNGFFKKITGLFGSLQDATEKPEEKATGTKNGASST